MLCDLKKRSSIRLYFLYVCYEIFEFVNRIWSFLLDTLDGPVLFNFIHCRTVFFILILSCSRKGKKCFRIIVS